MRFLWVVLGIVIAIGSVPLPVFAEETVVTEPLAPVVDEGVIIEPDPSEDELSDDTDHIVIAPATSTPEVSLDDEPTTLQLPVITEVQTAGTDEFIELYNPNAEPLPLEGLSIWYRGSGASVIQLVDLNAATVQPKSFAVFGHLTNATNYVTPFAKGSYSLNDTTGEVFLGRTAVPSDAIDKVAWGNVSASDGYVFDVKPASAPPKNNSLQRCFLNDAIVFANPRDTSKEFVVYANDLPTPSVGIACVIPDPPKSVNHCDGLHINEIAANTVDQFIELQNDNDHDISLEGCQLQTNRSQTKAYTFGTEVLPVGELRVVMIRNTELTLTKTTSGIVYVLSSDGQSEVDMQSYSNLASDTSWARMTDGAWAQTYTVTPTLANVLQKYLPCDDGYIRNDMTGRCNKIVTAAVLADCSEGQYRSEETGRCRSIPVASVLTACKLGQYRSEETNRCRNIVAASVQKPCKDNQYRSEETNRCRNLPAASVPESAFAVQPVKEGAMAFVGWWALGGVGLMAVGYGAWEWRQEIRRFVGQVASYLSAGR